MARFLLILAILLPLSLFSGGWAGWAPITHAVAGAARAGARLLGTDAAVQGNLILLPSRTLEVDPQCTAVDLMAVYAALVLAYPFAWTKRLAALLVGSVMLQVANIVRLVAVAWVAGFLDQRSFMLVHDYLFEFAMVFVVLMMWAVSLSLAKRTS